MMKHRSHRHGRMLVIAVASLALTVTACGSSEPTEVEPAEARMTDAGGSGGAAADELTPLRYQLAWTAGSGDGALYLALERGYYEEEGLDVTIVESQDPTAAPGLVGSGESELGTSYPPDVMLAAANGLPLISVGATYHGNPLGIVSRADNGITEPADLTGKELALTPLPVDQVMFDLMLKEAGMERGDVALVEAGFSGGQLVGEGTIDGASGVPWFEVAGLLIEGVEPRLMEYRDHGGLDFPFMTTIANRDYAEANPDVVTAFLRATKRGWEEAIADPDAALDAVAANIDGFDKEVGRLRWDAIVPFASVESDRGFGMHDAAEIRALADALTVAGFLDDPVDVEQLFTNDYLP